MEEKKQQEELQKKSKAEKWAGAASYVAGGAGIGAASYAYGQHRATEDKGIDEQGNSQGSTEDDSATNHSEEEIQTGEGTSHEGAGADAATEEGIAIPEPIAHIDGIDFEIQEEVVLLEETDVDIDDQIVVVEEFEGSEEDPKWLPEAELPESELAANDTFITIDDTDCDFIDNTIQQDLFA